MYHDAELADAFDINSEQQKSCQRLSTGGAERHAIRTAAHMMTQHVRVGRQAAKVSRRPLAYLVKFGAPEDATDISQVAEVVANDLFPCEL